MERGNRYQQNFRRFANATQAIDKAWSTCPSSNDTWTPTGVAWATNNAPLQVANGAGLTGVQKPGNSQPTNPYTAATEKIVADLACHLGLPVPPVTLWDRGASAGAPRFVAVSAWAFDNALTWAQAEGGLTPEQRSALIPWASAMLPFESWIGADDRQNASHVLVGSDQGGDILGAWIDYAFALDHGWKGNPAPACHVASIFPPVGASLGHVMIEVADSIVSIDDAAIEGIVNRIPSDYLPRPIAENIIRNLLARRPSVRALL
jgi:hypothetical protein